MSPLETNLQMNFYITLLCFTFNISFSNQKTNHNLRIIKKGLEKITPNAAGLVFFVQVNNTSNDVDYSAELFPDRCCLNQDSDLNCDVLEIIGGCVQTLSKGDVTTLKLVVPIIDLYERYGHCTAYLDTKDMENKRNVMRNNVDIPFDTRITNISTQELPYDVTKCKRTDQDPLNNCKPVDCKTFYNDKKPFYSVKRKRCVDVPSCISENSEIPTSIYDPTQNKCIDDPITKRDIDYVKQKVQGRNRIGKDIVIIKKFQESPHKISDAIDIFDNKLYYENLQQRRKTNIDSLVSYLKKSKWGMAGLFVVIIFQCCLICTMIYCMKKNCSFHKNKVLENKYFNTYRQEASVTTPLMGLTNETDTTRQFHSDSSNIDRRIHCYKACQKENQKTCLSDDILSKCVNRRNWKSRSEANKNVDDPQQIYNTLYYTDGKEKSSMGFETEKDDNKGKSRRTVKLNNKLSSKKAAPKHGDSALGIRKTIKENDSAEPPVSEKELKSYSYSTQKRSKITDSDSKCIMALSEKEIKCHSYNHNLANSGMSLKDSSSKTDVKGVKMNIFQNYNYNRASSGISLKDSIYSSGDVKNDYADQKYHNIRRAGVSSKISFDSSIKIGGDKTKVEVDQSDLSKLGDGDALKEQASVQASFPNDSIDDFLSERGMLFMTGENISKYSFSDQSLRSTTMTSRTSKNNLLRNVFSFLKRDRQGPSSEPGKSKFQDSVNLELIHMSRATMYSSSNNDNDCYKTTAEVKHSATSL